MTTRDGFDFNSDNPSAFLQWKNTDVCFDFYCDCGDQSHFDGYFAYFVECPHCHALYEMPYILFPRRVADTGQNRVVPEKDDDD